MAVNFESAARLSALKNKIDGVTGAASATLSDAVNNALAGYGQGGGGSADSVIDRSVTNITSNAAEVGQYAFYGCEQLETASFPEATIIRAAAFVGCKSLVSVSAPNVTEIRCDAMDYLHNNMSGNYDINTLGAFESCEKLTTVNIPAAETICMRTFAYCKGLTHLKFQSVKIIGAPYDTGGDNTGGDMGE